MKAERVDDLDVYQLAFDLQQRLFGISKSFPHEKTYSLTDQLRRASRSVGANIAEAWAKRRYPAHFRSKLTDADGEKDETLHWVRTAVSCHYLDRATADSLSTDYVIVGHKLGSMIRDAESWCPTDHRPPTTVHSSPSTVHSPPSTVHRPPA